MRAYILRRVLWMIPTLAGITIISFALIHLAPLDAAEIRVGVSPDGNSQALSPETIRETRELYGLDQPLWVQYGRWLFRLATLDFGDSLRTHRPVRTLILERAPASLLIGVPALILAILIAVPAGVIAARWQGSVVDRMLSAASFVLFSLPVFWTGTMAVVLLGGGDLLRIFPVYGLTSLNFSSMSPLEQGKDLLWHLALPVTCSSYLLTAVFLAYTRSSMLGMLGEDFVRTARAKGLAELPVLLRHALRNALLPLLTTVGQALPALIAGSIVIERIFSIPGMGLLTYDAIVTRDYPLVMAIFTMSAFLSLMAALASDIAYSIADPRIRYDAAA